LTRLERWIKFVLRAGVITSSACLALGLVLTLANVAGPSPAWLLQAGLLVLICTPAARVMISTVEYITERDWNFAALTAIVLIELIASAVAALIFNRRL
jgi:uncharacterized membrane protein